jgi:hypothetical protein
MAPSRAPIGDDQSWHALELRTIERHQSGAATARLGGDQRVERAARRSASLKKSPNVSRLGRVGEIESRLGEPALSRIARVCSRRSLLAMP